MKKIFRLLSVTLFLAVCATQTGAAAELRYTVDNTGGNFWQYNYTIFNNSNFDIDAFTVYFDYGSYDGLGLVCAPNGWDAAVWDPGTAFTPNDTYPGEMTAWTTQLLIAPGDSLSGFSVSFNWLGDGTPGAQAFDLLDAVGNLLPGAGGRTDFDSNGPAPVPEPGTLALFGAGILGLAAYCRRVRNA